MRCSKCKKAFVKGECGSVLVKTLSGRIKRGYCPPCAGKVPPEVPKRAYNNTDRFIRNVFICGGLQNKEGREMEKVKKGDGRDPGSDVGFNDSSGVGSGSGEGSGYGSGFGNGRGEE